MEKKLKSSFSFSRQASQIGSVCCFLLVFFLSAYNWGPLSNARWQMIDDHEIVATIGANNSFSFFDIPKALGNTEISTSSTTPRFRPSYYGLRFSEAALWGANPERWYYARIAVALIFGVTLTIVSLYLAGPVISFGFLVFALSRPYWVDIFARLGPAETYVVLGLSMVVLGMAAGMIYRWSFSACLAVALGIIIAVGSKENFVPIALILLWMLLSRSTRLSFDKKVLAICALTYSFWVGIVIVQRLRISGLDIYSEEVSLSSRIKLLSSFLGRAEVQLWSATIIFFVLVSVVIRVANIKKKKNTDVLTLLVDLLVKNTLIILILLLVFTSQYFFYSGKWPETPSVRYLFPGMLSEHLAILVAGTTVINFAHMLFNNSNGRLVLRVFASALFIWFSLNDFSHNRLASQKVVIESKEFTGKLDASIAVLKSKPFSAVVLNSFSFFDYEPIFAMQRFIRAAGLSNPITIKMNGYSSNGQASNLLSVQLTQQIEALQKDGGRGFIALQEVDFSKGCL